MRLIVHDLCGVSENQIGERFNSDGQELRVVSDDGTIKQCVGCFSCWVKTPGQGVIRDKYNNMGELMGKADELIIISQCRYGTYSQFVRNVLDRCLPYTHPYFTKRKKEIHHKKRYTNRIRIKVYFYGDVDEAEQKTAKQLVEANVINFDGVMEFVKFFERKEEILNENSTH